MKRKRMKILWEEDEASTLNVKKHPLFPLLQVVHYHYIFSLLDLRPGVENGIWEKMHSITNTWLNLKKDKSAPGVMKFTILVNPSLFTIRRNLVYQIYGRLKNKCYHNCMINIATPWHKKPCPGVWNLQAL